MNETYYNILEIPETSSQEEIKKAYRRLSMIYHPDKNKNDVECTKKFQKISEAYEILGDFNKRNEYDFMQKKEPMLDNLFSQLFSGVFQDFNMGGTAAEMGPIKMRVFPMSGAMSGAMYHGYGIPSPIVKHISIPMERIVSELTMPIDIERWIMEGNNKITENETIYIRIPKGVDNGEMILLKEKGNISSENCKGDVKIFIHIDNQSEFKRHGLDLIYEKTITLKEALCGFSFELKYLTGKIYTINNKSGNILCDNYEKIIPNMGLSREGVTQTGNLIILFHVKFPESLSEEVTNQLKEIEF
jgi:DnaJ-class molecular chaperone